MGFPNDPLTAPAPNTEALTRAIHFALTTTHRSLATTAGLARKYPAAVAPLAALDELTAAAVQDLLTLLTPGETTYILTESSDRPPPLVPGISRSTLRPLIPCLQMIFPAETAFPTPPEPATTEIVRLTPADAPAMVALTDIAFPGFFRPRTYEMGAYYGIWDPDPSPGTSLLIAMAGERLCLNPFRELSGVCTHPGHRGHGLAARLMTQLLRDHRAANQTSWLHVVSTNTRAIELYRRMGFRTLREVHLHGLTRTL